MTKSSGKTKSNPTFAAAALSYDGKGAPTVQSATSPRGGERELESLIRRTALRYGIPVRENTNLASKLTTVENESEIPEELYTEVAQLFCEVDSVKSSSRRR